MKNIARVINFILAISVVFAIVTSPAIAEKFNNNLLKNRDYPLEKIVQSPITLIEIDVDFKSQISSLVNKSSLAKEYERLLRISRSVGPDFNINIPLKTTLKNRYSITGINSSGKTWDNLTAGRTLNLISEEIHRLNSHSSSEIYLDLLVKEVDSDIYHPLNISLDQYVVLLLVR